MSLNQEIQVDIKVLKIL